MCISFNFVKVFQDCLEYYANSVDNGLPSLTIPNIHFLDIHNTKAVSLLGTSILVKFIIFTGLFFNLITN